jgi:DNA mismatch repair protein MLH1
VRGQPSESVEQRTRGTVQRLVGLGFSSGVPSGPSALSAAAPPVSRGSTAKPGTSAAPLAPQKAVRMDASLATIDAYLAVRPAIQAAAAASAAARRTGNDACDEHAVHEALGVQAPIHRTGTRRAPQPVLLTSVRELLASIAGACHAGLQLTVQRHTFVGVVTDALSLIQHGTKLLLVNHTQLARELFYQQALRTFGVSTPFALDPPLDLGEALFLALNARSAGPPANRPTLATQLAKMLLTKAAMLSEYFSIGIECNAVTAGDGENSVTVGSRKRRVALGGGGASDASEPSDAAITPPVLLTRLPRLVDAHTPQTWALPDLAFSLAFEVDWDDEKACFHTVSQALAAFYARLPPIPRALDTAEAAAFTTAQAEGSPVTGPAGTYLWRGEVVVPPDRLEEHRAHPDSAFWQVAHVLLPACRAGLTPPIKLAHDHHVVQLADTTQLYRIFERC